MKSRRLFLLLSVLAVVLAGRLYWGSPALKVEMPVIESSNLKTQTQVQEVSDDTSSEAPSVQVQGPSVKERIKNIRLTSIKEYREDARKNPHRPSEKMIGTVVALGEIMNSVTTEQEGREAVLYYKSCLQSESPGSLKAMCYRFSHELAKQYPGLQPEVASLDNDLNDEVRSILRRSRRE